MWVLKPEHRPSTRISIFTWGISPVSYLTELLYSIFVMIKWYVKKRCLARYPWKKQYYFSNIQTKGVKVVDHMSSVVSPFTLDVQIFSKHQSSPGKVPLYFYFFPFYNSSHSWRTEIWECYCGTDWTLAHHSLAWKWLRLLMTHSILLSFTMFTTIMNNLVKLPVKIDFCLSSNILY